MLCGFQSACQGRNQGQRDYHGSDDGRGDCEQHLPKQQPDDADKQHKGENGGQVGGGRGENSSGDLPDGIRRVRLHLLMTVDIFQHHNGAVDQHADTQRQSSKRHDIDTEAHD